MLLLCCFLGTPVTGDSGSDVTDDVSVDDEDDGGGNLPLSLS